MFSKRSAQIDRAEIDAGFTGHRARSVAARATRSVKRHTSLEPELLPRWHAELDELGLSPSSVTYPASDRLGGQPFGEIVGQVHGRRHHHQRRGRR